MAQEHSPKDSNKDELIEYRIKRLEEAIASLNTLKDIVIKWDSRFASNEGFLQCPLHKARIDELERKITRLDQIVEEINQFKWKAVGIIAAVTLVVQVFGTTIAEKYVIKDREPIKIEWVGSPTNMISHPVNTVK